MGVKHLMKEIEERCPDAKFEGTFADYSGKTIAIDASGVFHKYKEFMPISGILRLVELFRDNEITSVWVFDGTPLDNKNHTLEKRKAQRKKQEERSPDKIHKVSMSYVSYAISELEKFGVSIMYAKNESDQVLARLYKDGKVQVVLSGDSDMLAYGIEHLITDYNSKGEIKGVKLQKVLEGFGMTQEFFTDLCIIWGTDYADNPPGYGKVRGEQLLESIGTIEMLKHLKHVVSDELYGVYMATKNMFRNPPMDIVENINVQEAPRLEDFVGKGILEKEKNMIARIEKRLKYI